MVDKDQHKYLWSLVFSQEREHHRGQDTIFAETLYQHIFQSGRIQYHLIKRIFLGKLDLTIHRHCFQHKLHSRGPNFQFQTLPRQKLQKCNMLIRNQSTTRDTPPHQYGNKNHYQTKCSLSDVMDTMHTHHSLQMIKLRSDLLWLHDSLLQRL